MFSKFGNIKTQNTTNNNEITTIGRKVGYLTHTRIILCRLPGRNFLNRTFRPGTRTKRPGISMYQDEEQDETRSRIRFSLPLFGWIPGLHQDETSWYQVETSWYQAETAWYQKRQKQQKARKNNEKRKFTNRVLVRALDTKTGWIEIFFLQ